MPQVLPITGPAYETVLNENAQQLVNWYLEDDQTGGKFPYILRPTPGLTSFASITGDEVRGMIEHKDVLYAVVDSHFYSIDSSGTETSKGILKTGVTDVKMSASNDQILIVDGENGYVYDIPDDNFIEITDTDFPASPTDVTYQDGYFIVISNTDQKFYLSGINSGTSWNALDFASATADADNLVACMSDHREVWLFGDKSVEVWFNSGNATFPFERRPGVLLHKGCAARDSVVRIDNSIYWLAKEANGEALVVRASGYTPEAISSRAISQAIEGYTTIDDARAYSYRQGINEFYVLTFPTEDVTWVYNASTNQWHKWSSTLYAVDGQHRSHNYAYVYGKHLVGDSISGDIYELSSTVYTDAGTAIKRKRVSQHVHSNNQLLSIYNFTVDVELSVGLVSGQGSSPTLMLRVSKDGGYSWGNIMHRTFGVLNTQPKRVKWDTLGVSRTWTFELTCSDPVNCVVLGAYADIEGES